MQQMEHPELNSARQVGITNVKGLLIVLCCLLIASAAGAASVKIGIEKDNTLTLNSERFFPIGVAPGPPCDLKTPDGRDGWKELADGGINFFRAGANGGPWTAATEEKLAEEVAAAEKTGEIGAWVFLRELSQPDAAHPEREAKLRKLINKYKDSSGVYFWKTVDEPAWRKAPVEPIIKGYKLIKELDPNRPVLLIQAPRNTVEELRRYNPACDVTGADIYPVSVPMGANSHLPNKGLSVVGDYTKRMIGASEGEKPIVMVLQVTWSGVMPERGKTLVRPTFDQERYMVYQAIIDGANGINFFGFPLALSHKDKPYGWNWTYWYDVIKPLLAQIKKGAELNHVITAPKDDLILKVEGADDVEYLARRVDGTIYLLASKRESAEAAVAFSGLGASGTADVMFENRTVAVKNGRLVDTFKPDTVHVYKIGAYHGGKALPTCHMK